MTRFGTAVATIAIVTGTFAGVVAYQSTKGELRPRPAPADYAVTQQEQPAATPRTVVRWRPCRAPSRLRHGVCVTKVVRTVTIAAPVSGSWASTSGVRQAPVRAAAVIGSATGTSGSTEQAESIEQLEPHETEGEPYEPGED